MPQSHTKHVLLLGGTGFLGQCLAPRLVQDPEISVIIPVRRPHDRKLREHPNIHYLPVEENYFSSLQKELEQRNIVPDVVLNLVGRSQGFREEVESSAGKYLDGLLSYIGDLRQQHPDVVTMHFGSVAERKTSGEKSDYAATKTRERERLESSGLIGCILTHSIEMDNKEKIKRSLSPYMDMFSNSPLLMNRVHLSVLSADYLAQAVQVLINDAHSLSSGKAANIDIFERTATLQQFLEEIFDKKIEVRDRDAEEEKQWLQEQHRAVERGDIPDSLKKRIMNFITLALIDDDQERTEANHYLLLGDESKLPRELRNARVLAQGSSCSVVETSGRLRAIPSSFLVSQERMPPRALS